ncbi:uncharacterized protein B0H18DRAFT_984374 [Fomitopsis serialis]|uniref:uncharacterized protein n=1 Tax=Fomitopsis serialis TaxID=139415 RepID=UPI0020080CFA|nr:uncharacterized protein B0H18DRAFT_984374 [Neoantrodia serialis]KAH9932874.1 hypothetical protein B0H18DRAFT_984374 [Neoantrodia serialis]
MVRARLRYDRQTKAERVAPVLMANMTIAEPHDRHDPSADRLCAEVLQGKRKREREDSFVRVRPSLQVLFAQRQASLTEKVKKLREDYLTLHDRWMAHCGKLDEVAKAAALEEAAATAGRTTRRSAALGDAVRTDLEMEQIIASLGNEELTDADHLSSRNAATIPDMISVTKGSVDYRYDDTNNVVEDLVNFYTPNTCLEDWTEEEKEIFLEKYMLYPKQFGIIADFLPNKTTAECVTYYYLHKKTLIDFRKVLARTTAGKRKRGGGRGGKKKGNALLEDIRKHDAEVSRNSTASGSTTRRRRGAQTAENGEPVPRRASTRKSAIQAENSPGTTPTPDPDPEPRKRRRTAKPTARAAAAAEQEVDEDATEAEPKPAKRTRRSRKIKSAETVESPVMSEAPLLFNETRFIDQTELTARKRTPTGSSPWTEEDKELFVKLLAHHGDDFKRISASMPNKTAIQLSAYYKANNAELKLGKVAAQGRRRSPSLEPPASDGYREMSLPGSGVITPSTRASTPSVVQNSTSSANFEAQFRLDDPSAVYKSKLRASAPNSADTEQRPISRPGSSLAAPSSASSGNLQFRPTSLETMRAQYGTSSDALPRHFPLQSRPSPFASVIPPPLTMNGSPFVDTGRPIRPAPRTAGPGSSSGSGSGSGSGPLTMTFPSSFAYSNLSPSHFSGEQRLPPRGYTMRGASPGSAPASATMMFEASVFAPPGPVPMIRVASPFTFRADAAGVEESPVMPATLQTTEDLVAYLEHRSRFAEPRESDFM